MPRWISRKEFGSTAERSAKSGKNGFRSRQIDADHRFAARGLAEPLRDVVRQLRPDCAEKAACGLAAGIGKDRPDGAFLDNVPAVDDGDPVGDTFHGAYAIRIADARQAIQSANAAAALKCQRPGGRKGLVGRQETEQLLASFDASRDR